MMSSSIRVVFVLLLSSILIPVIDANKDDDEQFVVIFETDDDKASNPLGQNVEEFRVTPCEMDKGCKKKRNNSKPPTYANTMRMFQLPDYYNLMRSAQRRRVTSSTTTSPEKASYNSRHRIGSRQNPFIALATILNSREDVKRNLFVSEGWGASGNPEYYPMEDIREKNTNQRTPYAFTSNHWGPLGKRREDKSNEI